jgi:hypothetical protein
MVIIVREPNPWAPLAEGLGQGIQNAAQLVAQRAGQNRLASSLVETGYTPAQAQALVSSNPELAAQLIKRFQSSANMSKYQEILKELNPVQQIPQQAVQQQAMPQQEPQNLYGFADYLNKLQAQGAQGQPVMPMDRVQQAPMQQEPMIPMQQAPMQVSDPALRYKREADIYGRAAQVAFTGGDPEATRHFEVQQQRALQQAADASRQAYQEKKLEQTASSKSQERDQKLQDKYRSELIDERTEYQKVLKTADALDSAITEVERVIEEHPDYIGTFKSLLVGLGVNWGTAADIHKAFETLVQQSSQGLTGLSRGTKAILEQARTSKVSAKMTIPEAQRALSIMRFGLNSMRAYGKDIDDTLAQDFIPKGWAKELGEKSENRVKEFKEQLGAIKKKLTDADIDRFLEKANGDVDKAEVLAREAGFEV